MREVITHPRVLLLLALLSLSLFAIFFNGLEFGIDFKGGTLFQVQLEDKAAPDKLETISLIISERLDAFGLKDTKVIPLGEDSIAAQIAETDPAKIEQLESLLKTQGKFESTINGELLFSGSDILNVSKNPAEGYGVSQENGAFGWQLPFTLNQKAAQSFSRGVFHKCTAIGFQNAGGTEYDCEKTYFFIDRPSNSILVLPSSVYAEDTELLLAGNSFENIPQGTKIEEVTTNAGVPYILIDENVSGKNGAFTSEQLLKLKGAAALKNPRTIVHPLINPSQRKQLESLGFRITETEKKGPSVPWMWTAVGARQVISVTPGIANLAPYVADEKNAKIFSQLVITGGAQTQEDAKRELKSLTVLLETGSLPIAIKSISKETISPLLGKEFLNSVLLIGIMGLIVVSLVVFLRYRNMGLVLPIIFTGLSEIVLILGFASFFRINLDLAAIAGVLAAIGTGVDHQIIITDELMKGGSVASGESGTYSGRIKKAFFIIATAAATAIVTMLPLIIFSFGFGKLRGFAIITVLGALIGVLISRRAFSVFAEYIFKKSAQKQAAAN